MENILNLNSLNLKIKDDEHRNNFCNFYNQHRDLIYNYQQKN